MTCYHPLHAFKLGFKNPATGKDVIKVVAGNIDKLSIFHPKIQQFVEDIPLKGDHIKRTLQLTYYRGKMRPNYVLINPIDVPCGHCVGCRLSYAKDWAIRCVKESERYKENCFITLTYDDEHLKSHSLVKKDLQDFIKRLRSYYKRNFNHDDIRYFACGEYGEKYQRPHYHICFFNLPVPDKRIQATNFKGDKYYSSDIISSLWSKGFVVVADFNFETASYTARYVMKKVQGPNAKKIYQDNGLLPEFVVMSRRPGIGKAYFDENFDTIYSTDEIFVKSGSKIIIAKPCRYYDNLYDNFNHDHLVELKEKRRFVSEICTNSKIIHSVYKDKNSLLRYCESLKSQVLTKLVRNKI